MSKKAKIKICIKEQILINSNPSTATFDYWIGSINNKSKYPRHTENSGKWLIFIPRDKVDHIWGLIKTAIEYGLLGSAAKVSTSLENPNSRDKNMHVICVYSYDYTDKEDVLRIRQQLRTMGIVDKIPYKPDIATREGQYNKDGKKRVSVYYE